MPLYNIEAIVLRSRSAGEADKILTLFSRTHGKISAIAKGAKRPASKFGGRLEIFTYNKMLLASARSLDILSQCETIESFYGLREDKDKLNAGAYILRLVDLTTEERQSNLELFDLLLIVLQALSAGADPEVVSRAFEVNLCDVEGLMPSREMLENRYKRLPLVVSRLKGNMSDRQDMTIKDLEVSGSFFRELISDHTGYDIRRLKAVL